MKNSDWFFIFFVFVPIIFTLVLAAILFILCFKNINDYKSCFYSMDHHSQHEIHRISDFQLQRVDLNGI